MFILLRRHRNLLKRILHQMKTRLSIWKPRGCCVTHSFTFGFTTRCLQNVTEESYRNNAIQACLLSCNRLVYSILCKYLLNLGTFIFIRRPVFARIEYTKSKQVPLTHPRPTQTIATKWALIMLVFALFLQKNILLTHPLVPSAALSC